MRTSAAEVGMILWYLRHDWKSCPSQNHEIEFFRQLSISSRLCARAVALRRDFPVAHAFQATQRSLVDYLAPNLRELANYIGFLRDEEHLAPPSVARHLVALKVFYRFLRLEERTTETTVELLSSPTLWSRIPQVLSPENVNKLLDAPQPADRYYLRDRALLETLYATGSRAITSSQTDVFVSKIDSAGKVTLVDTLSGKGSDEGHAIALDSSGIQQLDRGCEPIAPPRARDQSELSACALVSRHGARPVGSRFASP